MATTVSGFEWDNYQGKLLVVVGITVFLWVIGVLEYPFGIKDSRVKAPVVGHRSWLEPGWLLGLRFVQNSTPIIRGGYDKFKDLMFKVRRNDANILIISNKYVDELRNLGAEIISPIEAHIKNLLGAYSTTDILLRTNVHTRVLQSRLTPSLAAAFERMKDELEFALAIEIPACEDEWVSVSIYDVLLRLIARVSARIFIGHENCRNEEWLHTSIHYTENVFVTVMTLRLFPSWVHPLIVQFLPSYWRVHSNLRAAKRIIAPIASERRAAQLRNGDLKKENDLLQWMMDAAENDLERQPETLAHVQLVLSLASIHTTGMAGTHAIYDICANPEYFGPLREEVISALQEDGGWQKTTLVKFKKMDSFIKESQRMNPPSQFSFNRVTQSELKLSDGKVLPPGTHFAMASDAILKDPAKLPGGGDPERFNGFRYWDLRNDPAHPENAARYQLAMTESSNLHFGHGKYACPGRFFASNELKLIIGHLLLHYDMKFPDGQGRPKNLSADENIFPDPTARVLIRSRKGVDGGIETLRRAAEEARQERGVKVPSRDPGRYILVNIHYPRGQDSSTSSSEPLPVFVTFHASGWIFPLLGADDYFCTRVAQDAGIVVIDADYRKAPESPHPAALHDAEDILRWIRSQEKERRFDSTRVALSGFSAGGNIALATATTLPKKSSELAYVSAVMAFYPAVDISIPSEAKKVPHPINPSPPWALDLFNNCYVPDLDRRTDPATSPAFADPASFPSRVALVTCEDDPLRPETQALAERLKKWSDDSRSRGPIEVVDHVLQGVAHAFDKGAEKGTTAWIRREEAITLTVKFLKDAFGL